MMRLQVPSTFVHHLRFDLFFHLFRFSDSSVFAAESITVKRQPAIKRMTDISQPTQLMFADRSSTQHE